MQSSTSHIIASRNDVKYENVTFLLKTYFWYTLTPPTENIFSLLSLIFAISFWNDIISFFDQLSGVGLEDWEAVGPKPGVGLGSLRGGVRFHTLWCGGTLTFNL